MCIQTHPCPYFRSGIISDDNLSVGSIEGSGREIKIWSINNGDYLKSIVISPYHSYRLFYLSVDRVVFGNQNQVSVWNLETNKAFEKKRR
jgi:hypothetical protein